jgi:hypothetical protein
MFGSNNTVREVNGNVYYKGKISEFLSNVSTLTRGQAYSLSGVNSYNQNNYLTPSYFWEYDENDQTYKKVNELIIDNFIDMETDFKAILVGFTFEKVIISEKSGIKMISGFYPISNYTKEVYLPSTSETISVGFRYVVNLTKLEYGGSYKDLFNITYSNSGSTLINDIFNNKLYCNGEKIDFSNGVIVPEGVTNIKQYTFYLKNNNVVTFPTSITTLEKNAFTDCSNLTLIFNSTTPPTFQSSFAYSNAIKAIYVPIGSGNAYKSATNLSSFGSKIFEKNTISLVPSSSVLNNKNIVYSINGGASQQFTSNQTLENVAVITIHNNSESTIKVGTTEGGTDIGSLASGSIYTYNVSGNISIYITKA